MGEGSSIIVFSSYCRGIRFIIFQTTSCKADVISVLFPLLSPRILSSTCRALLKEMFHLFRYSVCLVVQHISIGSLSLKEYFDTKAGQCFEGQGRYDSKMEHFWQCSISESLQWLDFLLHIQKINGERKPDFDLWVEMSKVNIPATLWLHFLSDRISLLL